MLHRTQRLISESCLSLYLASQRIDKAQVQWYLLRHGIICLIAQTDFEHAPENCVQGHDVKNPPVPQIFHRAGCVSQWLGGLCPRGEARLIAACEVAEEAQDLRTCDPQLFIHPSTSKHAGKSHRRMSNNNFQFHLPRGKLGTGCGTTQLIPLRVIHDHRNTWNIPLFSVISTNVFKIL